MSLEVERPGEGLPHMITCQNQAFWLKTKTDYADSIKHKATSGISFMREPCIMGKSIKPVALWTGGTLGFECGQTWKVTAEGQCHSFLRVLDGIPWFYLIWRKSTYFCFYQRAVFKWNINLTFVSCAVFPKPWCRARGWVSVGADRKIATSTVYIRMHECVFKENYIVKVNGWIVNEHQ